MSGGHSRTKPWKIGSFTKNFGWGQYNGTLKRLYDSIRIGFDNKLTPIERDIFRQRVKDRGYVDLIPVNFFLFNQVIGEISFLPVDELVYQAISGPHTQQFDRLATFTLLLSEVGIWREKFSPEQSQPSDWARYFIMDEMPSDRPWSASDYSADKIETYLKSKRNFEGNTYKISRNLSYFFNSSNFFRTDDDQAGEWLVNAIFLALDRCYLIEKPEKISLGWCIDTLERNEIIGLVGPATEFKISATESSARLFSAINGLDRFENSQSNSDDQVIAVLSRNPALFKRLPSICARWLSKRLFVELALDQNELDSLLKTDFNAELKTNLERVHNSYPRPNISGDEIIALFREDE